MRDFKNYDIWLDSMNLAKVVYKTTDSFPKHDAIIDQMRRAAVSIPSNIAEGSSRVSPSEFARYLEISRGSAFELETQIELSYILEYINNERYNNIINDIKSIEKRLYLFIKQLRTK